MDPCHSRYFASDRCLLRPGEAADSFEDCHPAYPGVIFRQFDVRNLDVSRSIRLAHQVDVEASLSGEQSAVSRDRIRRRGRGRPVDDSLRRLHRKAAASHFSRTGEDRRSCIGRGSYQPDSRRPDSIAAIPPRNVRAERRDLRRPGDAGILLVRAKRTLGWSRRKTHLASDLARMESDRATCASSRYAAIAGGRSFSMVESDLPGDRKSIVVAPGILGMDRIDGGVSVPARRGPVFTGNRLSRRLRVNWRALWMRRAAGCAGG